ncbi:hypothetical protein GQ53DRAFT_161168 [Thozetella sp. PMI_491]|nr:hypothetical protein GQ53DRAFT_161168 [Thozetella sp. PMI_491]
MPGKEGRMAGGGKGRGIRNEQSGRQSAFSSSSPPPYSIPHSINKQSGPRWNGLVHIVLFFGRGIYSGAVVDAPSSWTYCNTKVANVDAVQSGLCTRLDPLQKGTPPPRAIELGLALSLFAFVTALYVCMYVAQSAGKGAPGAERRGLIAITRNWGAALARRSRRAGEAIQAVFNYSSLVGIVVVSCFPIFSLAARAPRSGRRG